MVKYRQSINLICSATTTTSTAADDDDSTTTSSTSSSDSSTKFNSSCLRLILMHLHRLGS